MSNAVASTLENVDAQWLGEQLKADVASVTAEPLVITGNTTDMARLRVTYDESGTSGPETMVAKIRGRSEVQLQMDGAMGLMARELRFYSELADDWPMRVPKALAIGDGDTTPLVLEDLGGLRAGDQSQPMTLAEAEACVDGLADVQAKYWESGFLSEDWLVRPGEGMVKTMVAQLMLSGAPLLADFEGKVPEGVIERMPTDPGQLETYLERLAAGPHTICNNDCRVDNMFYADDGTAVMVDWQMLADARWSQDVANLLGGGMGPDDHSANWEALLRRYHDRITAQGVGDYSFDECVQHYRENLIWPLGQGMSLLGSLGATDDRGVGPQIVMRVVSHMAELDTFGALEGD